MTYTDTGRAANWRDTAACRDQDPEAFFPKGADGHWLIAIEYAKTLCRRCPVADACLRFALDANITDGIFGGLTPTERVSLRRAARRRAAASPTETAPAQPKRTLRDAWNAGARTGTAGHIVWEGAATVHVDGRTHTPKQVAFILDRGRRPQGIVLPVCGWQRCVNPAHLADAEERTRCGTRPGYQKHLRRGEEPCGPCRQANTDADNRLRWTGTTKATA